MWGERRRSGWGPSAVITAAPGGSQSREAAAQPTTRGTIQRNPRAPSTPLAAPHTPNIYLIDPLPQQNEPPPGAQLLHTQPRRPNNNNNETTSLSLEPRSKRTHTKNGTPGPLVRGRLAGERRGDGARGSRQRAAAVAAGRARRMAGESLLLLHEASLRARRKGSRDARTSSVLLFCQPSRAPPLLLPPALSPDPPHRTPQLPRPRTLGFSTSLASVTLRRGAFAVYLLVFVQ